MAGGGTYSEGRQQPQLGAMGALAASSNSLPGLAAPAVLSHSASAASLKGLAAMAEPSPCRTIYVRNISPDTDDAQLQGMFEVGRSLVLLMHTVCC